jgi:hypothetical protein
MVELCLGTSVRYLRGLASVNAFGQCVSRKDGHNSGLKVKEAFAFSGDASGVHFRNIVSRWLATASAAIVNATHSAMLLHLVVNLQHRHWKKLRFFLYISQIHGLNIFTQPCLSVLLMFS